MEDLDWTGERLVTSVPDLHGTVEHLHRYALAMSLAKGKSVLDIACGEGYGSNILSQVAEKVAGVDISEESVNHAQKKYKSRNLSFKVGSTSQIPFPDGSFDLVVSFETLEHHDEHQQMMNEIKRVLTPTGVLIISSPEKSIYKLRDPDNPYHIKELTLNEFTSLLNANFNNANIFDQRFVFGSLINRIGSSNGFDFYDGNFSKIHKEITCDDFYNRPFFNLAIASDAPIDDLVAGVSLFNGLNVLKSEMEIYKKQVQVMQTQVDSLKSSYSYRIGNALVKPFSIFKKK